MKKLLLILVMFMCMDVQAGNGNSNPILEDVRAGYSVGYTIDYCTVLGADMHMWHFESVVPGWYVAYNMNDGVYYYISQEAAQKYIDDLTQQQEDNEHIQMLIW